MSLANEIIVPPVSTCDEGRLRVAALFPDGVGVRNFVHGRFFDSLAELADVLALHTISEENIDELIGAKRKSAQWRPLLPFQDRPATYLLRNCLSYAQLYWVDTPSMRRERQRAIRGSWKYRLAAGAARFLGRMLASRKGIRRLDGWHLRAAARQGAVGEYRRMFSEFRPDVLFCSHQRPTEIIAPVIAAGQLGIPTASFIFSWDNLTSKGRIAAPFDHYLVWSRHMREELLRYYADVRPENVFVVGTPQFDPYADESLWMDRREFFARFGGDPARKLICFSGGVPETHMADVQHVRDMLDLIRAGRIPNRPQVLVRPAPCDLTGRFASLRGEYPELIIAQPDWLGSNRTDNWQYVIPRAGDVQFLTNLIRHADLNVNFGSTMTLDFAIHGKPVVNVVYDVADPPLLGMPLWDFVRLFDHYRPVIELGAARFAHSPDQLAEHVSAYLADPSLDREKRQQFVDLELNYPVGRSGGRIMEVLQQIAAAHGVVKEKRQEPT